MNHVIFVLQQQLEFTTKALANNAEWVALGKPTGQFPAVGQMTPRRVKELENNKIELEEAIKKLLA